MAFFVATESFDTALAEVEHLLACAQKSINIRQDYLTYLKAAIVLLGAKFEAFSENIVEGFSDELATLTPKAKHLSRDLRISSTDLLISQCLSGAKFSAKPAAISNLQLAAALWIEEEKHHSLAINNRFNYGKHGSSEVVSLFARIGISNILEECKVLSQNPNTLAGTTQTKASIKADIDSFTNIRNNIIHNDSTPSITHQQIHDYKEKFWEFSYLVDLRLYCEVETVKSRIAAYP